MPLVPLGSSWVNSDTESERRGCAPAIVTSDFMIFPVNCALNLRRFRDCFDRVFAFFYIVKSLFFLPKLQTADITHCSASKCARGHHYLFVARLEACNLQYSANLIYDKLLANTHDMYRKYLPELVVKKERLCQTLIIHKYRGGWSRNSWNGSYIMVGLSALY